MNPDLALLPTALALGLYLVLNAIFALALLRSRKKPHSAMDRAPRVTIFKPLAGNDDELSANLDSFASLDYVLRTGSVIVPAGGESDAAHQA